MRVLNPHPARVLALPPRSKGGAGYTCYTCTWHQCCSLSCGILCRSSISCIDEWVGGLEIACIRGDSVCEDHQPRQPRPSQTYTG
jgi:hypothetical protein